MNSLKITKKEASKVTHDINYEWHLKYQDKVGDICVIETHSHRQSSVGYIYYFINNGFNDYVFVAKYSID